MDNDLSGGATRDGMLLGCLTALRRGLMSVYLRNNGRVGCWVEWYFRDIDELLSVKCIEQVYLRVQRDYGKLTNCGGKESTDKFRGQRFHCQIAGARTPLTNLEDRESTVKLRGQGIH